MSAHVKGAALVTGAAKRIGKALALALAEDGYDVAVHFNMSQDAARDVVEQIHSMGRNAVAIRADLSVEQQTAALVGRAREELGALSVLINSASVFEDDDIETMSRDSWDRHIETNLRAPLKLSQDFAAQAERGGAIINLIDQRVLKLTPQFLSYTVSKAALFTLTQTLAQALGCKGVRVNAIGPGPVLRNARQSEADFEKQNAATILGHGASPDDVAAAMRYLLAAPAVTGQMIAVDGGQHLCWRTEDVAVKE